MPARRSCIPRALSTRSTRRQTLEAPSRGDLPMTANVLRILGMIASPVSQWIGVAALRISIAIVFLWIGALKFVPYEADSITPFVANSVRGESAGSGPAFGGGGDAITPAGVVGTSVPAPGVIGTSEQSFGLAGQSGKSGMVVAESAAVFGTSADAIAVSGISNRNVAVRGIALGSDAVVGLSATGSGVKGISLPLADAPAGLYAHSPHCTLALFCLLYPPPSTP